ncbi:glycine-rich protein-like [Ornithodoros turicata]|uniref:glycine-rich protein-like n=1 Tax=Ornithodoros turicata TaxID=34597 RepID=UPI003138853F
MQVLKALVFLAIVACSLAVYTGFGVPAVASYGVHAPLVASYGVSHAVPAYGYGLGHGLGYGLGGYHYGAYPYGGYYLKK